MYNYLNNINDIKKEHVIDRCSPSRCEQHNGFEIADYSNWKNGCFINKF